MNGYYSIGEFAKKIGKTQQTLRNWDKSGKLKPAFVSEAGYRYYTEQQLEIILEEYPRKNKKEIVAYIKGTVDKPGELLLQHELMKKYLKQKNYDAKILCDVDSGIRPTKEEILDLIQNYEKNLKDVMLEVVQIIGMQNFMLLFVNMFASKIERIVLISEDNIPAYDFPFFKMLCDAVNVEIEIIMNDIKKNDVSDEIEYFSIFSDLLSDHEM